MPETTALLAFGLIALGLVLTPGPNMIYLISRSISQGRTAGLVSLAGVGLAFLLYMLDVTERRVAERSVAERQRELTAITAASPDVIAVVSADLRVSFISEAVAGLFPDERRVVARLSRHSLQQVLGVADQEGAIFRPVFAHQVGHFLHQPKVRRILADGRIGGVKRDA